MSELTKEITVTTGFKNLGTLLVAAGYTGTFALSYFQAINKNSDPLYIHLSGNGTVPPADGLKGIPIGPSEASTVWDFQQAVPDQWLDAGTTWLYSEGDIPVNFSVVGGGI